MRKCSKRPVRDADYLASHIGTAFQSELAHLIDGLAETEGFKGQYLKSEYLRKYMDQGTTPPEVRRASAIKKWLNVEKKNEVTNARIMLGDQDFSFVHSDDLIDHCRAIVSKVLGPLDTTAIFRGGVHSNGASTRISRAPTGHIDKHSNQAHVSSMALKHWFTHSASTRLSDTVLELQEASVMFTVDKSSDIDRVACKEPEVNMLLQRCIGSHIRGRLKVFGIDLRDQSRNQDLARDALKLGLATVDLSSASDSISNSLVMALLPAEWWSVLDDVRSHYVVLPSGELHKMNMFSSMGNGFTFELETLLFWALTRSIMYFSGTKGNVSVYGDDIIAPSSIAPRLQRVFHWFGFTVNSKKSHWSGVFRESCGKHYHDSIDVTPFYLRGPVCRKTHVIRVLNRLLEWDNIFGTFSTEECRLFHIKWAMIIPRSLWGGTDPESIHSLVTGHKPFSHLVARASTVLDFDGNLGLTAWLTERSIEEVEHYKELDPLVSTRQLQNEVKRISSRIDSALSFTSTRDSTSMKVQARNEFQWHTTWSPWFTNGE